MRRLLPPLLLLVAACAPGSTRSSAKPREESDVRCTLVRFEALSDPLAEVPTWVARFRVVNGAPVPIEYLGYSPGSPLFQQEVLRDGTWENVPVGWCGTGLVRQSLRTGDAIEVDFAVPADGNAHRFRFGEPAVVTEAVRAPR
jgi:hypothetical protein